MNVVEARAYQDQFSALLREGWRHIPEDMEAAFAVLLMLGTSPESVSRARKMLQTVDDGWLIWLMSLATLGVGEVKIGLAEIEEMEGDEELE